MRDTKIKLFLDADDTVLQSSETIISILNNKYNINPPKSLNDLKDWGFRSIYKNLTRHDVGALFESDEFFDKVQISKTFANFYALNKDKFDVTIVTTGTRENLDKKKTYFEKAFGSEMRYVGLPFLKDEFGEYVWNYDKSSVDMQYGIQIDDRIDALRDTNASLKILIKNGDYHWNQAEYYANIPNLYVVHSWEEAIQIILFAYDNHSIFKRGGL